jgi:hypothetical protein
MIRSLYFYIYDILIYMHSIVFILLLQIEKNIDLFRPNFIESCVI